MSRNHVKLVIVDPPERKKKTRGPQPSRKGVYDDVLLTLKEKHPNEWGRIATFETQPKAHSAASAIRRTPRYKHLAGDGHYVVSARTFEEDGETRYGVWVKWTKRRRA